MHPPRRRFAAAGVIAAILLTTIACEESGDVQVSSIRINGNTAIDTPSLKAVIATREGGFLPWSRKRYFDRTEFDRDVRRIEVFYADRGYPRAKVVGVDVQLNDEKTKADITVEIAEGTPILVEGVVFEGLDGLPPDHLGRLKAQLPIGAGQPLDQRLVLAGHDMVVSELRDHGFPYGSVRMEERPGSSQDRLQLAVVADTGPVSVFGSIEVEGDVSVSEDVIRRELAFREGDPYRLSSLTESQRRLYGLELFQLVNIVPRLRDDRSPRVPVVVTLAEGKHRRLQLSAGYGSEERARGRIGWRHVNFGGGARTFEAEAKWSRLEQGVRGTLVEPYLFKSGVSLRLLGSSWWASEPTYTSRSSGGRAVVTKDFSRAVAGTDRPVRSAISVSLIREYQNYSVVDTALRDLTIRDQLISLGLDPDSGRGNGTLSALGVDFNRSTVMNPLDPRQGYALSGHLERAGSLIGGSFHYGELIGEARKYFPFGARMVWAGRMRAATLAGSDVASIPFSKRYFVGGSTSVRGWGRYQVSPLSNSGLPIGGRSMLEMSTEARFGIRGKLSGVLFVDGGNVWVEPWAARPADLRWAAGPGLRYDTPIGPMRFDLGIQLNPIDGLLINGEPEQRKWRVHFSIGQAF